MNDELWQRLLAEGVFDDAAESPPADAGWPYSADEIQQAVLIVAHLRTALMQFCAIRTDDMRQALAIVRWAMADEGGFDHAIASLEAVIEFSERLDAIG